MSILIKRAEACHLDEIVTLEREIFPDPWSKALLMRKIDDPAAIFCIAEREGKVLGYAILQGMPPEAEVINIAVYKEARCQGVGHNLLQALLDEAKTQGIATVYLEVRESNADAIALYASQGFKAVGLRKHYYQNPREHAILMTR